MTKRLHDPLSPIGSLILQFLKFLPHRHNDLGSLFTTPRIQTVVPYHLKLTFGYMSYKLSNKLKNRKSDIHTLVVLMLFIPKMNLFPVIAFYPGFRYSGSAHLCTLLHLSHSSFDSLREHRILLFVDDTSHPAIVYFLLFSQASS